MKMAKEEGGGGSKNDGALSTIIIVIIVILGINSMFNKSSSSSTTSSTNAVQNQTLTQSQKNSKIKSIEQQIKSVQTNVNDLIDRKNSSTFRDKVKINYLSSANSTNPLNEYILIEANSQNTENIDITGWSLIGSTTKLTYKINGAAKLFFDGYNQNANTDIILSPGEKAYIISGRSPLPNQTSLAINKCSGYLQTKYKFNPSLSRKCPYPNEEPTYSQIPYNINTQDCIDSIDHFYRCETQTDFPTGFPYECRNFITTNLNYATCVINHKNDDDFYSGDWRVYLNNSSSIWRRSKETIILLDKSGKKVDSYKY